MSAKLALSPGRFSGKTLGRYEVISQLSTGGMSEIHLGFQRGPAGFRKLVVLKALLPEIRLDEEFVRMFLDEAKMTAAFTHPNITQVFDLDDDQGELFLAMEFVQGATLVEVAKACRQANKAIPLGLTLSAVRDAALALHYAHTFVDPLGRSQQVIHRDVAEKNIMVTYDGTTKLLDFGIAKSQARLGRTQIGMVKGTSGYMSPEQILGEPLDGRTDIFSLGVVLHECLTGMRLFYGQNPEDGMMATLKSEIQPPSKHNRLVPLALDAVCLKALSRKKEERYSTALEFARELERTVGHLFWKPEQCGQFIQSLFAERREQIRQLYDNARINSEFSHELTISKLMRPSFPKAPSFQEEPEPRTHPENTSSLELDDERFTLLERNVPEEFRDPPLTAQSSLSLVQSPTQTTSRNEDLSSPPRPSAFYEQLQKTQGFWKKIPMWLRVVAGIFWIVLLMFLFSIPPFDSAEEPPKNAETQDQTEEVEIPVLNELAEKAKEANAQTPVEVEKPAVPTAKSGFLTLWSQPYSEVFFRTKSLGQTPLFRVSLPPGKHTLRLVGPNRQTYLLPLEIKEGKLTSKKVSLSDLSRESNAKGR